MSWSGCHFPIATIMINRDTEISAPITTDVFLRDGNLDYRVKSVIFSKEDDKLTITVDAECITPGNMMGSRRIMSPENFTYK